MNNFKGRYGPTAIVTGASSGIGAEFCRQLAAKGLDLVTVARREDVLAEQAQALQQEFGIKVTPLATDLGQRAAVAQLLQRAADFDIGLLVANAGIGNLGAFSGQNIDAEIGVVNVNAIAPMLLTHALARSMAKRGRGGIVLTGSTMGFNGVPYMATYAASKAFLLAFGEALNVELAATGIDVSVLVPGPTDTPMIAAFDMSKFPMKAMPVAPVVGKALDALGRRPVAIPGLMNNVMAVLGKRAMSRAGMTRMFGSMMAQMAPRA